MSMNRMISFFKIMPWPCKHLHSSEKSSYMKSWGNAIELSNSEIYSNLPDRPHVTSARAPTSAYHSRFHTHVTLSATARGKLQRRHYFAYFGEIPTEKSNRCTAHGQRWNIDNGVGLSGMSKVKVEKYFGMYDLITSSSLLVSQVWP